MIYLGVPTFSKLGDILEKFQIGQKKSGVLRFVLEKNAFYFIQLGSRWMFAQFISNSALR